MGRGVVLSERDLESNKRKNATASQFCIDSKKIHKSQLFNNMAYLFFFAEAAFSLVNCKGKLPRNALLIKVVI